MCEGRAHPSIMMMMSVPDEHPYDSIYATFIHGSLMKLITMVFHIFQTALADRYHGMKKYIYIEVTNNSDHEFCCSS